MTGYILENKLGISTSRELHKQEEQITKLKAIELNEHNLLNNYDPYNIDTLCFIHEYLFSDIYYFAGKIRNVDIAKGNTQFCLTRHMDYMISMINNMNHESIEDIIELYVEINLLHPFREGNGRATRIWLNNALEKSNNVIINWELIDSKDYMNAMIKSSFDDEPIKKLIKSSLTYDIKNKEIFFRGLDKSYEYEEFVEYSSENLFNKYIKKNIEKEK